jgi:hypothetical protein
MLCAQKFSWHDNSKESSKVNKEGQDDAALCASPRGGFLYNSELGDGPSQIAKLLFFKK